ncbi:MAG: type I restriction endonuclease [Verrucomicrobiota bacterium]|jgi:hypothetical protein
MNEMLADIKAKLQNGDYKNEEHVRLSLVARVLQNLGWDIWNPKEVNTEFIAAPNEDKTRVDVALFLTPDAPAVFIEIKGVGQIQRLQDIERQLRGYNRDNTAMFAIITDGREWRFYLSQTGGEFSRKCFKTLDFEEDDLKDIQESLSTFLSRPEIRSGNAKVKAENYVQLNRKQQTAEDCLPEARRKITEPPYPSLPDALVSLVREKEFSITQEEAIKFIKESAERPKSIGPPFSPPADPSPASEPNESRTHGKRRQLNPDYPENLSHTKLIEGRFAGESTPNWRGLVHCAMRKAHENGVPFATLRSIANISERNPGDPSFQKIEGTHLWLQGMDSNQAWKRSLTLAKQIRSDIHAVVLWREKEGAAHPGEEAEIQWSPSH